MAAGARSVVKRAFGALLLFGLLLAGWTVSGPTYAASPVAELTEGLTAGQAGLETNPRADARPSAPPYAIARKQGGSARSEHKRYQPPDSDSPDGIAALAVHGTPLKAPRRHAQSLPAADRAARPFRGFRFLSRAPPGVASC
jgi:hypothetical protein